MKEVKKFLKTVLVWRNRYKPKPDKDGKYNTGVLPDTRSVEEKQKDYHFAETVASGKVKKVDWQVVPEDQWPHYETRNQDGSGSCVAQTVAKMIGIMLLNTYGTYMSLSARFIYNRRSNKPASGMIGVDALNIATKEGIIPEKLLPSQNMNDKQLAEPVADSMYHPWFAKTLRTLGFVLLPIKDIEIIASTMQATGKPVMVWYHGTYTEWSRFIPTIIDKVGQWLVHHSITAILPTMHEDENGNMVKAIIIDDQWGQLNYEGKPEGKRVITEKWHKERNTFAAYFIGFKYNTGEDTLPPVTPFEFKKDLVFIPWDYENGQPVNPTLHQEQKNDVMRYQDILKKEGLFPKNIDSTGYFGSLTRKANLAFQKKYNVSPTYADACGPKTRKILNELYS